MTNPDIPTSKSTLSPRQRIAAAALIAAPSVAQAASAANVTERTLYRWLELPEFRALVSQLESRIINSTVHSLVNIQQEAIDIVSDLSRHSDNDSVKLRAAKVLLDTLLKLRVQQTFEERLADLEQLAYQE
jgi:transposase-like protein